MFDPAIVAHLAVHPSAAEIETDVRSADRNAAAMSSARRYQIGVLRRVIEQTRREAFEMRVREWLSDTQYVSSISEITSHPKFAEILEMKDIALRLILEEISKGVIYFHWFPALKRIAKVDPVAAQDRGMIPAMANAWLEWGKQNGKIDGLRTDQRRDIGI